MANPIQTQLKKVQSNEGICELTLFNGVIISYGVKTLSHDVLSQEIRRYDLYDSINNRSVEQMVHDGTNNPFTYHIYEHMRDTRKRVTLSYDAHFVTGIRISTISRKQNYEPQDGKSDNLPSDKILDPPSSIDQLWLKVEVDWESNLESITSKPTDVIYFLPHEFANDPHDYGILSINSECVSDDNIFQIGFLAYDRLHMPQSIKGECIKIHKFADDYTPPTKNEGPRKSMFDSYTDNWTDINHNEGGQVETDSRRNIYTDGELTDSNKTTIIFILIIIAVIIIAIIYSNKESKEEKILRLYRSI